MRKCINCGREFYGVGKGEHKCPLCAVDDAYRKAIGETAQDKLKRLLREGLVVKEEPVDWKEDGF